MSCQHHWDIEATEHREALGVCRFCHELRTFSQNQRLGIHDMVDPEHHHWGWVGAGFDAMGPVGAKGGMRWQGVP